MQEKIRKTLREIREFFYYLGGKPKGAGIILMLHRVSESAMDDSPSNKLITITPQHLEKLIIGIKKKYDIIHITELPERISSKHKRRKFAVITFDDGFKDVYTHAYPILIKYNIPFTLFVSTCFPDKTVDLSWCKTNNSFVNNNDLCITWDEIKEMSQNKLVSIGAHTISHYNLRELQSYEEINHEIFDSCKILKKHIGRSVDTFAYPYGAANNKVFSSIQENSIIKLAVLASGGPVLYGTRNLIKLPRIIVTNETSPEDLYHYRDIFMGI